MTADWVHLPYEFLARVSNDIINKVRGVNRVVYDISSKPPATIEWGNRKTAARTMTFGPLFLHGTAISSRRPR